MSLKITLFFVFVTGFLAINFQFCYAADDIVTVFAAAGYTDDSFRVNVSQCSNLPVEWRRVVSSISTHGICARLFDGSNCTGSSIEVMPTSPAHYNLEPWDFDNMAISLGPCRSRCDSTVTGSSPDAPFQIELYTQTKYRGLGESIGISGCMLIPNAFLNRTMSINTHGHCLQLYNNPDCNEHLGRNVELRRGTPYHEDISQWGMVRAKSLSHCSHKCNDDKESPETLEQGDVVLFDERNFAGNYLKISAKDAGCHNISSDWNSKAWSVQLGNFTCITLFNQSDCVGGSLFLNKSDWDLSQSKFNERARSYKYCEDYIATIIQSPQGSSGGTSPLLIFIIILVVVIAGGVITVMWSPNARHNFSQVYGTMRNRLFNEDGEAIYSGGFHWDRMPRRNSEPEVNTKDVESQTEAFPSQALVNFDLLGEPVIGGEVVYEELVYKDTVEPVQSTKKPSVRV